MVCILVAVKDRSISDPWQLVCKQLSAQNPSRWCIWRIPSVETHKTRRFFDILGQNGQRDRILADLDRNYPETDRFSDPWQLVRSYLRAQNPSRWYLRGISSVGSHKTRLFSDLSGKTLWKCIFKWFMAEFRQKWNDSATLLVCLEPAERVVIYWETVIFLRFWTYPLFLAPKIFAAYGRQFLRIMILN